MTKLAPGHGYEWPWPRMLTVPTSLPDECGKIDEVNELCSGACWMKRVVTEGKFVVIAAHDRPVCGPETCDCETGSEGWCLMPPAAPANEPTFAATTFDYATDTTVRITFE